MQMEYLRNVPNISLWMISARTILNQIIVQRYLYTAFTVKKILVYLNAVFIFTAR